MALDISGLPARLELPGRVVMRRRGSRMVRWMMLAGLAASSAWAQEDAHTVRVDTAEALFHAVAEAGRSRTPVNIRLAPGEYRLIAIPGVDSTCGNCEDPDRSVPMSLGLPVSGRGVWISGEDPDQTVIHTGAGYGVYFNDCDDCGLERVTVTGGERDTAQAATDAGVVVKRSSVTLRDCVIRDNIGDAQLVYDNIVGIMGVCVREDGFARVERCEILRNSWDGVALYRDARAVIEHSLIDGVDGAGREAGGGRGVGIGVTWNGQARIEKNLIRHYWKGVGIFVDADVEMRVNFIENMRAWGIALWSAGKGRPTAVIEENLVYDCGACGISITREAPLEPTEAGRLVGNYVVHTGQNPKYDEDDYYCYQCALALHAVPEGFVIDDNTFYDNRRVSGETFSQDRTREYFWRMRRGYVRKYRNTPIGVDGRHSFWSSSFLQRYTRF
jgi:hypothetical protein